jgi:hypothetical protein
MQKKHIKNFLIWFFPAVMLLIASLPLSIPFPFIFILQIVVTVCAIVIAYFLFTQKPQYYLPWAIVFIVIALVYNPIIHFNITMGISLPMHLLVAILFIANWWFVFKSKSLLPKL